MHVLAISEQGTTLHAEGDLLVLRRGGSSLHKSRVAELDQVLLFGRVEVTAAALALLLRRGVDLVLVTQNGKFRGRLIGRGSKNVTLRLAQYQRTTEAEFCLGVARALVAGKLRSQRQILLRAQRRLKDEDLAGVLGRLRLLIDQAAGCGDLASLRGIEGAAAAQYFGQFPKLLRNAEFTFDGRNRRPPRDPVNALLSFGYAVLGSIAETEVYRCGLDPLLGFFHQPLYGRPSLMLDLLEEFRPVIDTLVLRVVNRRQLGPGDFDRRGGQTLAEMLADEPPGGDDAEVPWWDSKSSTPWDEPPEDSSDRIPRPASPPPEATTVAYAFPGGAPSVTGGSCGLPPAEPVAADVTGVVGVFLNEVGRKVFLNELFRRLRERVYYPPREATLELRDVLRQQIYHAARVIEGKDPVYVPFVAD